MAEISVEFRNIVGSKKCAVSSPRIVSLEIGDESPGGASESAFHGFFLDDQVSRNDVKSNSSLICGCDKQSDKNFLIHSQSFLSNSTCDEPPSDKIKSTSDIDVDLLDLLNSAKLEKSLESGVENFDSKKNTSDDKMKIISNGKVSDDLSNLLSSNAHESSEPDEVNANFEYCRRKNTQDCKIDLLDFEFAKHGCAKDSLSSNNSSLQVEDNLSELLSSIHIDNSGNTNVRRCNSSNMCNSIVVNKCKTEKEPCVADLSNLLSSIDLGNSNDSKVGSYKQGNMCNMKVVETKNELCLADLLSSMDMDKSNKAVLEKEPCKADLTDLLSSIDLGEYNSKVEIKNESNLAGLLQSLDISKSDKPALSLLNNKPVSCGNKNLFSKDTNDISDSVDHFTFDVSYSSSSNSCASSFSETENNSPKGFLTNNYLTDKVLESDSGYSSFDSAHKEFSFFDYSSDNQFSFNTLLTKKSDINIATKHDCENSRNTNEEMSMSDLLNVVSPEFKTPVLPSLNKVEKFHSSVNKDCSSMLDLIESLNIKSKNFYPDVVSNNSVECDEKLMEYDCIDGRISKNIQSDVETINFQADSILEKNISIGRSDILNEDEIVSDDEQITFIDLRECIKSTKHQFIPTSSIKQVKSPENQSLECFSPNKTVLYSEKKSPSDLSGKFTNPFEFNDTIPGKKIRVNTKQTMFSKALACKPKKDQSLLQKVANIKNELLTNIIYRPVFIDCDVPQPLNESVLQSDRCIVPNLGLVSFGLDARCELQ